MSIYWWAAAAGIFTAILAAAGVLWRFVWLIFREMQPNGGSSLRDAVNKISVSQERTELWQAGHDGLHEGLKNTREDRLRNQAWGD